MVLLTLVTASGTTEVYFLPRRKIKMPNGIIDAENLNLIMHAASPRAFDQCHECCMISTSDISTSLAMTFHRFELMYEPVYLLGSANIHQHAARAYLTDGQHVLFSTCWQPSWWVDQY